MNLSRLTKIDLREVWKTEAQDFTPWPAGNENLELLGDAIGLDLELEAVEKNVGPFELIYFVKRQVAIHGSSLKTKLKKRITHI